MVRPGTELSLVKMKTTVTEFSLGGCGLLGLSEGESDGQWRERDGGAGYKEEREREKVRERETCQDHDGDDGDDGGDAAVSREEWGEGVKYRSKTFISYISGAGAGADPTVRTQAVVLGCPPSPYQLLEIPGTPRPELPPTHRAAGQNFYKKYHESSALQQPFM